MATVQEFLDEVREDWLDDNVQPYLWSNVNLVRGLNNALREIGRRRESIYDDSGDYNVTLAAGTAQYDLDSDILTVEDVVLASSNKPVRKVTYQWLDYYREGWRDDDEGTPTFYVENPSTWQIRLHPIPDAPDTLYLKVNRMPGSNYSATNLAAPVSEPEDVFYHEAILHGICAYAYHKKDADAWDGQRQAVHEREFTRLVGPPISSRDLLARRENANLKVQTLPHPYTPRIHRHRAFYGQTVNGDW